MDLKRHSKKFKEACTSEIAPTECQDLPVRTDLINNMFQNELWADYRTTPPTLYDKHPNGLPRKPVGVLHPCNKVVLLEDHRKLK